MRRFRQRIVVLVLLPTITLAAIILGYYTWQTAKQYERLGEETIAESTLLLVHEKVDHIERQIINADNAVFATVNIDAPETLRRTWLANAPEISPSVRAVLVLDDAGTTVGSAYRGTRTEEREFEKVFFERILPDLELERQRTGRLKHLHRTYADRSYLISYKAVAHRGHRYYVIAYHDTAHIISEELSKLFATVEGKSLYNVVDGNGARVFGSSLARAGDYLVGRRFPTTLYEWRLQVAPKQAPWLDQQGRNRRINEVGLIATSYLVILLGVIFLLYAADKERRLNALKSEFIANVSHELKTPLSVVRMFAELLLTRRVQSAQKQHQYLEIICKESQRLSGLIENVLDFAALERGRAKYQLQDANLPDVLNTAIDTFRYRIEHDGVEVVMRCPEAVPVVRVDEQAIMLAVINLLDNAVKYGGGAPIEVLVRLAKREVEILVRDRGPGISKEHRRRIFERFYRVRTDGQTRGSGIGLSLVKHIAEAHGGRAWAEPAEDRGAIVAFSIALDHRNSKPAERPSIPPAESIPRGANEGPV